MTYLNKNEYPQIVVDLLSHDDYMKTGDYSASQLCNPSYQIVIDNGDFEKTMDIDNMFAANLGTGFHMYAEKVFKHKPNHHTEIPFRKTIDVDDKNYIITGTADLIVGRKEAILYDWKTVSTYPAKKIFEGSEDSKVSDYAIQMSVYAWLAKDCGYDIEEAYAICPDIGWTKREKHPRIQCVQIDLFNPEEFIRNKIRQINSIDLKTSDKCEMCSQWRKDYCGYKDVCPARNRKF